ncbi:hypothetical protein HJFPF1_09227 [Paramyrothecium foliicola]|nr:hypothetical protein HJFPF1_09227 [Paramyrothecium foliicola]
MIHRVPKLPKAKASEVLFIGAAGLAVLTPIYLIMPGADDRLEKQTTKWAGRWDNGINYFTPPVERGVQRIEPPVSRTVQRLEDRLPLERMAKGCERTIQNTIDRFTPKSS